jgi:hypothetical protein
MSFVARVQSIEAWDTWRGMESAADERFWDGVSLAKGDQPRRAGAIYLLGYVAEMVLKVAYFRFTGIPPSSDLGARRGPLDQARQHTHWHGRNLGVRPCLTAEYHRAFPQAIRIWCAN